MVLTTSQPVNGRTGEPVTSDPFRFLERGDLVDAALVAAALERRSSATALTISSARPQRDDAAADGEDVGVVVLRATGAPCRGRCTARRAMPRTLLAAICSPWPLPPITMPRSARRVDDRARHPGADIRIVDRLARVGAEIVDLVSEPRQRRHEMLFQREARMVGADRDPHDCGIIA